MHTYSTNSPVSPSLYAFMMSIALAISAFASYIAAQVHNVVGWSVGGVSAMTVFGGLYLLFDRYLWKRSFARRFLLVPDLNGRWTCTGKTLFKNGVEKVIPWSATMVIRQSWSRISIRLKTGQSGSTSVAASIFQEPGNGFRLIYYYDNEPKVGEKEISRHTGLCRLVFNENVDSASGDYFSDKDRMTVGTMQLHREGNPDDKA